MSSVRYSCWCFGGLMVTGRAVYLHTVAKSVWGEGERKGEYLESWWGHWCISVVTCALRCYGTASCWNSEAGCACHRVWALLHLLEFLWANTHDQQCLCCYVLLHPLLSQTCIRVRVLDSIISLILHVHVTGYRIVLFLLFLSLITECHHCATVSGCALLLCSSISKTVIRISYYVYTT